MSIIIPSVHQTIHNVYKYKLVTVRNSYSKSDSGISVSFLCNGVSASDARAFHVANMTILIAKLSHVIIWLHNDLQ